jgi:TrmH family RNA methyltransferase
LDGGPPQGRTLLATHVPEILRRYGYRLYVADASAELAHWKADLSGRVALILGSEAEGPDPVLWAGAERLAIPLLGRAESLNVGMAAAVLLYEVARHREGWKT